MLQVPVVPFAPASVPISRPPAARVLEPDAAATPSRLIPILFDLPQRIAALTAELRLCEWRVAQARAYLARAGEGKPALARLQLQRQQVQQAHLREQLSQLRLIALEVMIP